MRVEVPRRQAYPKVFFSQYPAAIYREVVEGHDWGVDLKQHRHLRFVELFQRLYPGRGGQARMARDFGRDATYIGRLLYPATKKGAKGLGEDTIIALENRYHLPRNWFDMPIGTELPQSIPPHARDANHITPLLYPPVLPSLNGYRCDSPPPSAWPFPLVDRTRYERLSPGHQLAIQERINELLTSCEAGIIAPIPDTPAHKRSA